MLLATGFARMAFTSGPRRLLAQPVAPRVLCKPLRCNMAALCVAKRGFAAEPMHNFGELSEFVKGIMAGPEQAPAWLRDFDTKPIGITVKFKTKPEQRNNFVKTMRKLQGDTIAAQGVVAVPHFKFHTSTHDENVFYLIEEWASAKALKKHFEADYSKKMAAGIHDLLVSNSESPTSVALYDIGLDTPSHPRTVVSAGEGVSAEPMENFAELSDFAKGIMAGPDEAPAWLKDFDTQPIGITVKFKTKPEQRAKFIETMKRLQGDTIAVQGVVAVPHFKFHKSPLDDNVFYLLEEWASAKALKKHFLADYSKKMAAGIHDLLVPSSESQTRVALYNMGIDEK